MNDQKEKGIHYTPKILADFVAAQIFNAWAEISQSTQTQIQIFDPAVGDGQLLNSLLQKAASHSDINANIFGLDIDSDAIHLAKTYLENSYPNTLFTLTCHDFIDFVLTNYTPNQQLQLFSPPTTKPQLFDIVIANPPYVRTQVMGAKKAQQLATEFGLTGRVDLYYAFIVGIAKVLKPNGLAGIIVSNRFLTTKSGASVRKNITEKFEILHIWDLGDTKLFKAAILPSVLLVKKKGAKTLSQQSKFTSIYSVEENRVINTHFHYPVLSEV